MGELMRAVVKSAAEAGAELVTRSIPRPGADEVLVRVKATSICGTDVHIYGWNSWAAGRIRDLPQILGHEFAGEVVEVGSEVRRIKVGDFISAETHIPCRACKQCLTGQMHICNNLKILGVDCDGCFAEYAVVPEIVAWKNDPSVAPELAAVQEPLGNAVYCTLVEPVVGKSVLIFGDGPTGLFAAAVAHVAGASKTFLVGRHPVRMEIARKVGATQTLDDNRDDIEGTLLSETDGLGVDVVLDMAGTQRAIDLGFKMVRKGGRFSAFGVAGGRVSIDLNDGIVFKGVTVYGINGRLMFDTWFEVRNLLASGRLDISPIITHKLPLSEFAEGFELMVRRPKVSGKVVLIP